MTCLPLPADPPPYGALLAGSARPPGHRPPRKGGGRTRRGRIAARCATVLVLATALLCQPAGLDGTASAAAASGVRSAPGDGPPAPSQGVWPLQPRPEVVTGFDPPVTRWGSGHRGVDLLGHLGQAVHTSLAGRVRFAGTLAGRGVVVVDHGDTRTTYEPVAASVSVGDQVAAGQVVGRLELFGSHCFPRSCVHWGLIQGLARYLDPLTLVGAAPVRLLPWRRRLGSSSAPTGTLAARLLPRSPGSLRLMRPTGPTHQTEPTGSAGQAGSAGQSSSSPAWTPLLPVSSTPWLRFDR